VDIPVSITKIVEGASKGSKMPSGPKELINTFGQIGYDGPQPPKGSGQHNYETIIYAIDVDKTDLSGKVDEKKILSKIQPHLLSQASMVGLFVN
jgi:Raf kinase inhibitor-like YbhB/YbcL family protein